MRQVAATAVAVPPRSVEALTLIGWRLDTARMHDADPYPLVVARFYDAIYHRLRSSTDSEYFVCKAVECDAPVLEVGVGTGRLFREALARGVDIFGIDPSKNMIARLRAQTATKHHDRLSVQDVRTMDLDRCFGLIMAPFRVFAHLLTIDDQLRTLDAVHRHLLPGGRLIFDLFVPNLRLLADGLDRLKDFDGEYEAGKRLRRYITMKADLATQLSHVAMEFVWDEDGEEKAETWHVPLRFFFRQELEHLIARSPLRLVDIHGDYSEGELRGDSTDYVVVCER